MCLREIPGWPRNECMGTLYCACLMALILLAVGAMMSVHWPPWEWDLLSQCLFWGFLGSLPLLLCLWTICVWHRGWECWNKCTRGCRRRMICTCLCDVEDEEELLP